MSKQSQKEAVFTAVSNVLKEAGITISETESVETHMTRERRAQINSVLLEGFKSGKIEMSRSYEKDADLKAYVSGLLSNWIRKDKRLNGNVAYVAQNPGSRAGSGDEQLKAMRALLATETDAANRTEIQGYIDTRVAELKASKVKTVKVDFDALPAALKAKFAK